MISFKCSKADAILIGKITRRAVEVAKSIDVELDAMTTNMDVTACHANGCPLRLNELLAAPDFDFTHDIFGIRRHIDRETGKLGDCFLPRFAVPRPAPLSWTEVEA